jgi:hypothetical protein
LVHLINTVSAIVFLLVTAMQKPHSPIPYSPKEIIYMHNYKSREKSTDT